MALPTTRRRDFLALCAGASAACAACAPFARLAARAHGCQTLRAVVFDAFPIFDPRSLDRRAEQLFPGRSAELMTLWRTRQFEYTWLRTAANRHVDFWRATDDALAFAAGSLGLDLTTAARASLMQGYLTLDAWPDVREAIAALASSGLVLGFLSNFTGEMLAGCVAHADLGGVFRHTISTESARTFKPDPRAYRLGTDARSCSSHPRRGTRRGRRGSAIRHSGSIGTGPRPRCSTRALTELAAGLSTSSRSSADPDPGGRRDTATGSAMDLGAYRSGIRASPRCRPFPG